jgi:IS30 family transposase
MAPIDDAIAAFESQDPEEKLSLREISKKFGVVRSTLTRRVQGQTRPKEVKALQQQLLSPQQEIELCLYIEHLTKQGLPPTRAMIQNFASEVAKTRVSEAWVTRFVGRHHDTLISKWSSGIDAVRHRADSKRKYELYFDLLYEKINYYKVLPSNTYNMDEKGFIIGVIGRTKRIFSRA